MTQPDEWTEQDTAALGDLAYSKLEAEVANLRNLYTHEHNIAQEQADRANAAEAEVARVEKQRQVEWSWAQTVVGQVRAERDEAKADVARLQAALRDLDAMRRNFNAGWDRVIDNSGQDAAGG